MGSWESRPLKQTLGSSLWATHGEESTASRHFFPISGLPLTLCDIGSILMSLGLLFLEYGGSSPQKSV